MTYTNSNTLRNALAAAVKSHVESNGMTAKDAAATVDVQLSRFYQVLRGEVSKISSDALVNMLGGLGYRLDSVIGATEGHEFTLTLDEGLGLPKDIEPPITPEVAVALREEVEATRDHYADADPDADRVIADEGQE